ncbi:DUF6340 family protein [Maribacter chungangensis]|uniref:DUF6340 family protein n=1 Tax=Maribacter chungangensis TaxID=1069117 RepID=A0ABW3B3L0_9FLAO
MKYLYKIISAFVMLVGCFSCTTTKQLKVSFIEPSPVELSNQIQKIGIINSSKALGEKTYANGLEQLIVLEERWLAEKGTEAALTGLFDELAQDTRFEDVKILSKRKGQISSFGANPDKDTWDKIALICKENGVDALFSLASHEAETKFSLKKTKVDQLDLMRVRTEVSGQQISLETLIENGWRIYDPKQKILIDEFTTNQHVKASGKGINQVDALQAIDNRRESLLKQSKQSGSSYGHRMQPKRASVYREYFISGSKKLAKAHDKIQNGAYHEARLLWEQEITNSKTKVSGRASHNLAVLSEFNGDLNSAMKWALKSFDLHQEQHTLLYIKDLEQRQALQVVGLKKLASNEFLNY